MVKLKNGNFDDTLIRNAVIDFFSKGFNKILISNQIEKKIDLLEKDDPECGVEVEHGKWIGNFWENETYNKISGLGFSTINIPSRKEKYWLEYNNWYNKIYHNPSWLKNIFVRSNKDFTQFIVIKSEVIRDPKKLIRTSFQPNNSNEVENWLSFKCEDVDTYNLIDNQFILEIKK